MQEYDVDVKENALWAKWVILIYSEVPYVCSVHVFSLYLVTPSPHLVCPRLVSNLMENDALTRETRHLAFVQQNSFELHSHIPSNLFASS